MELGCDHLLLGIQALIADDRIIGSRTAYLAPILLNRAKTVLYQLFCSESTNLRLPPPVMFQECVTRIFTVYGRHTR